ncbi:MAG: hypothetical protein LCH60_13665 [Actinobacteria bacterium]|uniref:Uncharacterized protein n=1 Tax=Phycicoccus elongatus Lp2 TaxID=1193181 RepID=N0E0H7_9MICO|nr:hypothetical protein [Phycicoccus elongatus]MCA0323583.1 hypothetical protein [Actinomycetota bacterium]CCH69221.1 hypothetical protein BN10_140033 [Phycicoccus elongatus Lp2]
MKEAVTWINDKANKDKAIALLQKNLSIDAKVATQIWEEGHDSFLTSIDEDMWKKNMEFSTGKADSVPFSVVQNDCGK